MFRKRPFFARLSKRIIADEQGLPFNDFDINEQHLLI